MTSKKVDNKNVQCDECGYTWKKLKKVKLKQQVIEFNNRQVVLHYFLCPVCKKVYRIFIEGPRYNRLEKRLKKSMQKLLRAKNEDELKILQQEVSQYQRELEEYVVRYDKMFSGTFAVNVSGYVEYRP